jgi:hypothetical protein
MKNAGEARCPGRRQDLCPLAGLLVPLGDLVSYPHARERKSRLSGRLSHGVGARGWNRTTLVRSAFGAIYGIHRTCTGPLSGKVP